MIAGVGVDLERTARFRALVEKEAFFLRVYTDAEREYLRGRPVPWESAAGLYCAKEALGKALGCGLTRSLFREAEVLHSPSGAPWFRFSGALAQKLAGSRVHLSITHGGEYAAAYVIWEGS